MSLTPFVAFTSNALRSEIRGETVDYCKNGLLFFHFLLDPDGKDCALNYHQNPRTRFDGKYGEVSQVDSSRLRFFGVAEKLLTQLISEPDLSNVWSDLVIREYEKRKLTTEYVNRTVALGRDIQPIPLMKQAEILYRVFSCESVLDWLMNKVLPNTHRRKRTQSAFLEQQVKQEREKFAKILAFATPHSDAFLLNIEDRKVPSAVEMIQKCISLLRTEEREILTKDFFIPFVTKIWIHKPLTKDNQPTLFRRLFGKTVSRTEHSLNASKEKFIKICFKAPTGLLYSSDSTIVNQFLAFFFEFFKYHDFTNVLHDYYRDPKLEQRLKNFQMLAKRNQKLKKDSIVSFQELPSSAPSAPPLPQSSAAPPLSHQAMVVPRSGQKIPSSLLSKQQLTQRKRTTTDDRLMGGGVNG